MATGGERRSADAPAPRRLRVVLLLAGDLDALRLWTLKALVAAGHEVGVVRIDAGRSDDGGARGLAGMLATCERHRQQHYLDRLFGVRALKAWWGRAGVGMQTVEAGDVAGLRTTLAQAVVVTFDAAAGSVDLPAQSARLRLAVGDTAAAAERWRLVWGVVSGRREYFEARIHAVDVPGAAERVVWRGTPQISPGDTGDLILFRMQIEAVQHLLRLVATYASGAVPATCAGAGETAPAPPAPGVRAWVSYVALGRGRRARVTYERALVP